MKQPINYLPAFPHTGYQLLYDGPLHRQQVPGMSLRDYFAGQALMGDWANPALGSATSDADCAKSYYKIADAMLKEREKEND